MAYRYAPVTAGVFVNGSAFTAQVFDTLQPLLDPLVTAGVLTRTWLAPAPLLTVSNVSATAGTTLTGAQLAGGIINRTGPTAAFSDTTDTAANILAALPNAYVGMSVQLHVINNVAFACTLVAGTGVTLAGTTAIAASQSRAFELLVTDVATPAVTVQGISGASL